MADEPGKKAKNILVFRIGHLGDTIVALPAYWALRAAYSDSKLTLLSNADNKNPNNVEARDVLPETGLFDKWITYPSRSDNISNWLGQLKLLRQLRRTRFDSVFYLMTRNRTMAQIQRDTRFFRLAGIKTIYGIRYLAENLLPSPIPVPTPETISETQFLIEAIRSEGVPVSSDHKFDLAITDDERSDIEEWLQKLENAKSRPLVAVAPGSKWPSKIWPVERFEEVLSRLIAEFNIFPIALGGSEDVEVAKRLISNLKCGAVAAGELTVRQSAALLERCILYLGNDTGTMHLAGAVGTPCVAIFAAVDWIGRWKPFGEHNHIFREHVECEGCHSPICRNENKCLDLIRADDVFHACREMIMSQRVGQFERV